MGEMGGRTHTAKRQTYLPGVYRACDHSSPWEVGGIHTHPRTTAAPGPRPAPSISLGWQQGKGGIYDPKGQGSPNPPLASGDRLLSAIYKLLHAQRGPFCLTMCTGTCSRVVGAALWPFALLCIVANLLLAFPNWKTEYVQDKGEHLTPEVLYLGGIVGGGIMVLVPAIHIQATGRHGCCGNRCGMFISVASAAVGLAGSLYALSISALGLLRGPLCQYQLVNGTLSDWERPFWTEEQSFSNESYLFHHDLWDFCRVPEGVIEFNVILFSLILGSSVVELVLCGVQVVNGLCGCLCGTCNKKEPLQTHY